MRIRLEAGPGLRTTITELSSAAAGLVKAVSAGLQSGAKYAASKVTRDYLSGQSLKRRTGELARNVDGWLETDTEAIVGVREKSTVSRYAWLLGDETKTIRPVRARALTIPIGENLTAAGVARFATVKDAVSHFGTIFRPKGTNVLGYSKGRRGKFRALFALAKEVRVEGSGALYDGVTDSEDKIAESIRKQVEKVL